MTRKALPPLAPGTVDRSRALPLWRQVQTELERDIVAGAISAGERFPTEAELSERFSVHRHTVRRAIESLRERNLIRVEHGHGIFVRERTVPHALTAEGRLSTTIRQLSQNNDRKILGTDKVQADPAVSRALQIRSRTLVRRVDMLGGINGAPATVSSMYFPLPRFIGIERHIEESGSITGSFAKLGVEKYQRKETRVSARLPTKAEADLLDQPRTLPVMTIWSLDIDSDGKPVAYSQSCISTRWIELVVRF
ncbi:phosphonate metabolism transcriptional regulator PhnF [Rhizobium sp.]